MGKIQKALFKIFIDFAIKYIKINFFEKISNNYLTNFCLILQYLYDFELKQKKSLENSSKI